MKYYKIENNEWILCEFSADKKQINLYDDNLKFIGIGLF
mgnify:CR=1 FL=1